MGRVPCLSAGSQSGSIGTFVDCFRSFCGSNSNSDPTTGSSRNNSNTSCSSGNSCDVYERRASGWQNSTVGLSGLLTAEEVEGQMMVALLLHSAQ